MKITNKPNRFRFPVACVLAGLLFAGCSSVYTPDNGDGDEEKVTLRFIASGIEEQTEETLTRMGAQEQVQESFAKTDDGLMMVSSFSVDTTATKTRASVPMADGVKYRVAAYQSGVCKGTAEGTAGVTEATLGLAVGSYTVVAYSMNTTTLPTHSESLSLTTTDDFLWVNKGPLTITNGSNTDITLTFVHQRCAVTMQADASVIVHDPVYASLWGEGAKITNLATTYSFSSNSVKFAPATGAITADPSTSVSPSWTGQNTMVMSTGEVYFYPTSATANVGATFNDIAFSWNIGSPTGSQTYASINKTVNFTLALTRGTKYTLKTIFHKLCGAKMAAYGSAGAWKQFQCFNMGATATTDPFTPSAGINGNYYEWGAKNFSVSGPPSDTPNSNWNPTYSAPNGTWQDAIKTSNDPCPNTGAGLDKSGGWRVPTQSQWVNVANKTLNKQRSVGTDWSAYNTNFSTGRWFGNNLFLPTPGYRQYNASATLAWRGAGGYYWASTPPTDSNVHDAARLYLLESSTSVNALGVRTLGMSVRCVAE